MTIKLKRGEQVRKFEVIKQLSHEADAGMAVVYLVRDKYKRQVVLKIAKASEGESKARALQQEINILRSLKKKQCRNIISLVSSKLYEFHKDGHVFWFIVLEYMNRGSLKDRLRKTKKFSLTEISHIVTEVSKALTDIHRIENLVHLDVKPANILFGNHGQIVLSDFGVTRDEARNYRDRNRRTGTLLYSAPEQLEKNIVVDHRADIYALGLILYEMLAGQHPVYAGSTGGSREGTSTKDRIAGLIKAGKIPRPSELNPNPNIPAPLEAIIMKATAPRPENRYNSARDLAKELRAEVKKVVSRRRKKQLIFFAAAITTLLIVMAFIREPLELFQPAVTLKPSSPVVDTVEPVPTPGGVVAIISDITSTVAELETKQLEPVETKPSDYLGDSLVQATRTPFATSTLAPTTPATPPDVTVTQSSGSITPRAQTDVVTTIDTEIVLLEPPDNFVSPGQTVEFKWRQIGEKIGCSFLPDHQGFEIRIWAGQPDSEKLGAMDAKQQDDIKCDNSTGIYEYTVANVMMAPGVQQSNSTRFWWTVAVVDLEFNRPIFEAEPHLINLPAD